MGAPITIPVTFDSANRRKDKSVRLMFSTNLEIATDDYAEMDRHIQEAGWLLFSPNEMQVKDIPADDAPLDTGQKKPSVWLRGIIYRIWEQETDRTENFDYSYYPRIIRQIGEQLKDKLI